ncbi:MAG: formylglycine-generating enzyme family protein, partial [Pirellulales bacterium]
LESPPHGRRIRPFLLDTHEVTVGEFKVIMKRLPMNLWENVPPDDHAVCEVSYDEAVHYAELVGKRLPTEAEYEFAATGGGQLQFPWGDSAELMTEWSFGPVGEPRFDKLLHDPPVFGLYSNVAEWTSSWGRLYPNQLDQQPATASEDRIVRGAPVRLVNGQPDRAQWSSGPRARVMLARQITSVGLGFRCARSTKPRRYQNDFTTLVVPSPGR